MSDRIKHLVLGVNTITKRYGSLAAIRDVSFELRHGEVVAVIGSSGSGKSTLLRCIDLLEWIDAGSITYGSRMQVSTPKDEKPLIRDLNAETYLSMRVGAPSVRRGVGFVFQGYDLWDEKTVLDNLILAPVVVGQQARASAKSTAGDLCRRFGLADKLNARAWQLSGGQRQRIAIIRALMMKPELLLLDEVTSSLDPLLTYEVMELIRELKKDGMTMLLVTHHWRFASGVADRVIFMHDGHIIQEAPPAVLARSPATSNVEKYLNVLNATG